MNYRFARGALCVVAALLAAPTQVLAQEARSVGGAAAVSVTGAWVRGTVTGQSASGAFMELTARDNAALVGASSPLAAAVELHEMIMDGGVMKMRAVPRLELPAGKTLQLKSGSYHLMLLNLKQPLKKGDSVPLTLQIESRGKVAAVEVKADVRDLTTPVGAPADSAGSEHAHHHMH